MRGYRATPYHGKVIANNGDYKVKSVLGGSKRHRSDYVFASEAEALNFLTTGVVDVSGAGASYFEPNTQLTALVAEKSLLYRKLKRAKTLLAAAVQAKKQAVGRQKKKQKASVHEANQKASKLVKYLEYELRKTKGLADAESKKSTRIIETLMLDLLRAEKKKLSLERDALKAKEASSKRWEIMKSLFRSERLDASDLSGAGDRVVEKYKVFLEEANNRTTERRLENEVKRLNGLVSEAKGKIQNLEDDIISLKTSKSQRLAEHHITTQKLQRKVDLNHAQRERNAQYQASL